MPGTASHSATPTDLLIPIMKSLNRDMLGFVTSVVLCRGFVQYEDRTLRMAAGRTRHASPLHHLAQVG